MPLHTLGLIEEEISLKNKKLAILGIAYRQDVGDTRFSPSEVLYRSAVKAGAKCYVHDPYLTKWAEIPEAKFINVNTDLLEIDVIVLAVRHNVYQEISKEYLVKHSRKGALIVDTFNILDDEKIQHLLRRGRNVIGVGKGHIRKMKSGSV